MKTGPFLADGLRVVSRFVTAAPAIVNRTALLRAVFAVMPLGVLAAVSGREIWLQAALVTVSADVSAERSGLAPVGIILQGLAIAGGFVMLVVSFAEPAMFVVSVSLLAVASVIVTAKGSELRTVGVFTFIPALYLAYETGEQASPDQLIPRGLAMVPYLLVAIVPVLLVSTIRHSRARLCKVSSIRHFRSVLHRTKRSEPADYISATIAIGLAVAVAASLVRGFDIAHGHWVIWSAASIVTGDAASARAKFADRLIGAVVGVPVGVAVGLMLPHYRFVYELDLLVTLLTFVAFNRYRWGFGVRCGCAAIAFILLGHSTFTAGERAANVIVGGLIGLLLVVLVQFVVALLPAIRDQVLNRAR